MTDKNLIALADSFMDIFGYKRIATVKDKVITPKAFECEYTADKPLYHFGESAITKEGDI